MNRQTASSRRAFLKTSAAAGAVSPLYFPSILRGSPNPNGKLQHACIGVGGMGWGDLHNFLSHPKAEVVAICDVDSNHLDRAAGKAPGARKYRDWRELFDKEGDKIDSVNVTVPDHMHAPIAMTALSRGKHVYCQKPMCHEVAEVRALTRAAREAGVVTQLGTQHASGIGDRMAVQFIREGAIGKIKHAYLCSNRPGAIDTYRLVGPRPEKPTPVPAHLDWNRWIGTAPERPFSPSIYHPAHWRAWQDFGTGWSGDIGCHIFDAVWKGLGLTAPITVKAEVQESWKNSAPRRGDTWPQSDHITWEFPGTPITEGDTITVEWFDGLIYPPEDIRKLFDSAYPGEAAMLIGTEGALLLPHTSGPILLPREKYRAIKRPKLPGRNHYHHFVDACVNATQTESHFEQTGPMTEAVLLGTVAIRNPDQLLRWNPASMTIPGEAAAQKMLRRDYRDGWAVEGLPG